MSCDCITINNGGSDGADGIYGGYSTDWIFDSASTISGVTSKYIRFNNATVSSITVLYVSIKNSKFIFYKIFCLILNFLMHLIIFIFYQIFKCLTIPYR